MSAAVLSPIRVLASAPEVFELLAEAAQARAFLLTSRELRRCEKVGVFELRDAFQSILQHEEHCLSNETREMLGAEASEKLGHAPNWLEAGSRLEELLVGLENHGRADYVFCLDPWAAQVLNQSGQGAPDTKWILISDVEDRKDGQFREYWEQLGEWFGSLPFHAVVPRMALDRAIAAAPHDPPAQNDNRIHLQKPGAWQWRRIATTARKRSTKQDILIFLVGYSGSLLHLRIFLDTISRQDYPKESLLPLILSNEDDKEVRSYLKWFSRAHPSLEVTALDPKGWKLQLQHFLHQHPEGVLVLIGDHSVLPERFACTALEISRAQDPPVLVGIPLDLNVSAQILTGNLDPIPHYQDLLGAFSRSPEPQPSEIARVIPPEQWKDCEDPVSRIMASAKRCETSPNAPPVLGVLQLADEE